MNIGRISCKPSDGTKRLSLLVENIRCIFYIVCIGSADQFGDFTSHINNLKKKKKSCFRTQFCFCKFLPKLMFPDANATS